MQIIGIDPGQKGGICLLSEYKLQLIPMPETCREIFTTIKNLTIYGETHVFLEKAQAMPKQGIASTAHYMRHFGNIEGLVTALNLPLTLVAPQTWTRIMHVGTTQINSKAKSLEAVQRLFPRVNLMRTDRCRKPDEGFVDALLIAAFGSRHAGVNAIK
jgi:crossover junction endodeoxyribonuclease RuvC